MSTLFSPGPSSAEKAKMEKDRIFAQPPIPDQEQLKRTARRKAAFRKGSRVETILTDTLGPGGG